MAWVGVSRYRLDISFLELLTVRFTYRILSDIADKVRMSMT